MSDSALRVGTKHTMSYVWPLGDALAGPFLIIQFLSFTIVQCEASHPFARSQLTTERSLPAPTAERSSCSPLALCAPPNEAWLCHRHQTQGSLRGLCGWLHAGERGGRFIRVRHRPQARGGLGLCGWLRGERWGPALIRVRHRPQTRGGLGLFGWLRGERWGPALMAA